MLHVFRLIFVLLCGVLGWRIGLDVFKATGWQGLVAGAGIALCCVLLELSFARRFISVISVLMFGILVGFVVSHFVLAAVDLIPALHPETELGRIYRDFGVTFVFSFLAVLAIFHTKDDFKFVIPFVEFSREGRGTRPMILDTSVIIDGRIVDLLETRVVDAPIVVPRFVLNELQQVSDSSDKLKRNRGRRGLDILNRLRKNKKVEIQIHEAPLPGIEGVDAKLVRLAKMMDGRVVTTDFNLNKVAEVQGVDVVNVNDLANAMRPVVLQGERLTIKMVKPGESPGQGIGYLEDGTMVVGQECHSRIGQHVELVVTNILQTSAGRMVFGRPADARDRFSSS